MNETWWLSPDELDDDQRRVIELPLAGRFLVLGPPGSGKTNLLLLRANFFTLSGKANLAVVVYTRALKEFLQEGASKYAFEPERVKTLVEFLITCLRDLGEPIPPNEGEFPARQRVLVQALNDALDRHHVRSLYDVLLVDEGQDYTAEEIALFGRVSPNLFVVADHRQQIYESPAELEAIKSVCDDVFELRFHYRTGLAICRVADRIGAAFAGQQQLVDACNYNETARPSSVELVRCANDAEVEAALVRKLSVQIRAYPEEPIGVLVALRKRASALDDLFSKLALADEGDKPDPDLATFLGGLSQLRITTIHSAKGLEFRAVHLAYPEDLKRVPRSRNLSYTAVTRAKTALTVYSVDAMPGFLEAALVDSERPRDPPAMVDLFGRRA